MTLWFSGGEGVRLAADSFGPADSRRPPVLLVGGLGQTRHSWRRVAQRLAAEGHRAVTLDIRGHGESDRSPTADYGYARQAEDIAAVAAGLGGPVTYVGASLGGKIGLATAAERGPGTVGALVLVDSVPHNNRAGTGAIIRAMTIPEEGFASPGEAAAQIAATREADPGGLPDPATVERLRRNMRQSADGRWHWHWDARYRTRDHRIGLGEGTAYLDSIAPRLTIPVLLAWCELSDVVGLDGVTRLKAVIPQLEVEVIPGARHMIVGDENDVFADAMIGFLARHNL